MQTCHTTPLECMSAHARTGKPYPKDSMGAHEGFMGSATWRNNSMKEIKQADEMIARSDKYTKIGQSLDPVPHIRDILAELSNNEAHKYTRDVRLVVLNLRNNIIAVNEEVMAMNRTRESLEKMHEHLRKDIKVNKLSMQDRRTRPNREKCNDGVDDLLDAEKCHLRNLKMMIEAHLKLCKEHLQVLGDARTRLTKVIEERSIVLDLKCSPIPNVGNQSGLLWSVPKNRCRPFTVDASLMCKPDTPFPTDQLGPYTPECEYASEDCRLARIRSMYLRKEADGLLNQVFKIQKEVHETVNQGIIQKGNETENLRQHLDIAFSENRMGKNRTQRWYDYTENGWYQTRGAEKECNVFTREKLTRPQLKVMQRHVGTNLPEAQEIIRNGDEILHSLHTTAHNIGLLKLANRKLGEDIRDKRRAIRIDDEVVHMRRHRQDKIWKLGGVFDGKAYN